MPGRFDTVTGRAAGRRRTAAKVEASRVNGRRGGRPPRKEPIPEVMPQQNPTVELEPLDLEAELFGEIP